jgi:hypothetical protein
MTATQFFLLLSAIYIAPHLNRSVSQVGGIILLGCGIIASWGGA